MSTFIFEKYAYQNGLATFEYRYEQQHFQEKIRLQHPANTYDKTAFDSAMQLAHLLLGISYYKAVAGATVEHPYSLSPSQAAFFTTTYRDGLSQFIFENDLSPDILPVFVATSDEVTPHEYDGKNGFYALQSGGKDSLLLAKLLQQKNVATDFLHITPTDVYPDVLNHLPGKLVTIKRSVDIAALKTIGGYNGHVPVTYLVQAIALLQAILDGKQGVLAAIGHEGEEPYHMLGDYAVRHQWSKTAAAEKMLIEYLSAHVGQGIVLGSPLRTYSELRIAELFVQHAWIEYSRQFSSCNEANYRQDADNRQLAWCGCCAKCANNFLLFAPFVQPSELARVIGSNMLADESLRPLFLGLMGIDGYEKPFECVGETEELRLAYEMARAAWPSAGYGIGVEIPVSTFDYRAEYGSLVLM